MKPALKLLVLLVELLVQKKRRDDNEQRQERLVQAKDDPVAYLRQFGRVREVNNPASPVRGDPASTEQDDIQQ